MKKIAFASLLAAVLVSPANAATIVQGFAFANGFAFARTLTADSGRIFATNDGTGVFRADANTSFSAPGRGSATAQAQIAFNQNTGSVSINSTLSNNFREDNESSASVDLSYLIEARNTGSQTIELFLDYGFDGASLLFDTPGGGAISDSSFGFSSDLFRANVTFGDVRFQGAAPNPRSSLASPFGIDIPCAVNPSANTALSCSAGPRSGSIYIGTLAAGQGFGAFVNYDVLSILQEGPSFSRNVFSITNARYSFRGVDIMQNAPVPEPATWAMMILGFGVIGAAMRRRRSRVSFG